MDIWILVPTITLFVALLWLLILNGFETLPYWDPEHGTYTNMDIEDMEAKMKTWTEENNMPYDDSKETSSMLAIGALIGIAGISAIVLFYNIFM